MKILALEPYYGGSHKAFIDGWISRSRHEWTLLTTPPHGWKWRMRHSAASLGEEIRQLHGQGQRWDAIFCTDMVNLAELCGLIPSSISILPRVVYFHENQFVYPIGQEDTWDAHFGLSNMYSSLAADSVWWNSAFNLESFISALGVFLKKMRKPRLEHVAETIESRSRIEYLGVNLPEHVPARHEGPVRIIWPARWEHDKSPEIFFEAIDILVAKGLDFRIMVTGEGFRDRPACFDEAEIRFADYIEQWGYVPELQDFFAILGRADVVVSTASHEFFGIAMVEAAAAGAMPLLPNRLAYPEVFGPVDAPGRSDFFYGEDAKDLARSLARIIKAHEAGVMPPRDTRGIAGLDKFCWSKRAVEMDDAIEEVAANTIRT